MNFTLLAAGFIRQTLFNDNNLCNTSLIAKTQARVYLLLVDDNSLLIVF